MPGPRPQGDRALTPAERNRRYRERLKAAQASEKPQPKIVYRRPQDRRSRPQRWQDAVAALLDVLDDYQAWRDSLPDNLADSAIAERLDAVLALRELVEELDAAELPKGFGRD